MADNTVNETGFSLAQIRTITEIIAAAFAQERAQNQTPPTSSNQPVVEEREIPEPTLDNQASTRNAVPVENDLIKQLVELKDKVEKMSIAKEKDPVTNFHSITVKVGEVPESEDEQIQLTIQKAWLIRKISDFDERLIKSPEPSFEQLVEGTQFMVDMVQTGSGTEWVHKISEFEDFLGIGDEASRMVQEQKAKARILQSVLA
ncbi:hypothetical protein JCGZ_01162 [Jatropha curcas]|uniref:Uncharacterized protein n=1 Tax=Jatropha curcas TaxID=180498 RepID=A0A067JGS2_JATCU|nr:hypothetical protein JCGZ_01162 [Jatropha curcas]